jgi:hypothetical protein
MRPARLKTKAKQIGAINKERAINEPGAEAHDSPPWPLAILC